jgi:hypothetical protein
VREVREARLRAAHVPAVRRAVEGILADAFLDVVALRRGRSLDPSLLIDFIHAGADLAGLDRAQLRGRIIAEATRRDEAAELRGREAWARLETAIFGAPITSEPKPKRTGAEP